MSRFLPVFFILFFNLTRAQVTVPYRVGDKFGISDEHGKMLIPANYDVIDVHAPNEFTATKRTGNSYKTTYIFNNKIILSDTDYNYFSEESSFITAVKIKNTRDFSISEDPRNSFTDVYTLNGKKLFEQSFRFVNFIEDDKKPNLKEEILVLTNDLNGKYRLLLLNKKTTKVIRTFFESAVFVDTDYDQFPSSFSVKYVLAGETDVNQLTLTFENGQIKAQKTETLSSSGHTEFSESYGSYSPPPVPYPHEGVKEPTRKLEQNGKMVLEMKEVDLHKRYTEPYTHQTMALVNKKLSPEYAHLVKNNDKWGFFGNQSKDWILPPVYDEIILDEGKCVFCSTYVVREGAAYRIIEFDHNKKVVFPGKFEKFPHFSRKDFGRTGFQLIQLFDQDGKFFAYANQDGKVYYSK